MHWSQKDRERNFRYVCDEHAPKPNPKYQDLPLEYFVGKYVKLGVDTGNGGKEHLWYMVTEIEGEELVGKLGNDPLYIDPRKCAVMAFNRSEIEDVLEE